MTDDSKTELLRVAKQHNLMKEAEMVNSYLIVANRLAKYQGGPVTDADIQALAAMLQRERLRKG